MNKINLQSDLFLGVPEIKSISTFLGDDYILKLVKSLFKTFGIVKNENDTSFTNLQLIASDELGKITIKSGLAINDSYQIINVLSDLLKYYTIPDDDTYRYIHISNESTFLEKGTLSINATGLLTGVGTEFSKFRIGDYPTKIKLTNSTGNTGEYEILSVTSDTVAQLVGTIFILETDLNYKINGTFSQGVSIANKELYTYDNYKIDISLTDDHVTGSKFLLGRVKLTGGTQLVEDLRTELLLLSNSTTLIEIQNEIKKNVLGIGTGTYSANKMLIDINNCIFETTQTSSSLSINDILFNDLTTVTTGKTIFLKIVSVNPFTIDVNGSSNITYINDLSLTSIVMTNDILILYKTATKWILLSNYSDIYTKITGRTTLIQVQDEIKKNVLGIGNSSYLTNNVIIDPDNCIYNLTLTAGNIVKDIINSDNSTVGTGKLIYLKTTGSATSYLYLNSYSSSNIDYPDNSGLNSLIIQSDVLVFYKTASKWILLNCYTDLNTKIAAKTTISAVETYLENYDTWHVVGNGTTGLGTSYLTGWTGTLQFKKDVFGNVYIKGTATRSGGTGNIFALPSGYRPTVGMYSDCVITGITPPETITILYIEITGYVGVAEVLGNIFISINRTISL